MQEHFSALARSRTAVGDRRGALLGLGEFLPRQCKLAERQFEEARTAAVRPAGEERQEHHRGPRGVSVSRPRMACDGEWAQDVPTEPSRTPPWVPVVRVRR